MQELLSGADYLPLQLRQAVVDGRRSRAERESPRGQGQRQDNSACRLKALPISVLEWGNSSQAEPNPDSSPGLYTYAP
jgi:hypothetical protein